MTTSAGWSMMSWSRSATDLLRAGLAKADGGAAVAWLRSIGALALLALAASASCRACAAWAAAAYRLENFGGGGEVRSAAAELCGRTAAGGGAYCERDGSGVRDRVREANVSTFAASSCMYHNVS
eukprot:SAG31_NODE_7713_length_1610_cov_1.979484_2_plen_125_part_00